MLEPGSLRTQRTDTPRTEKGRRARRPRSLIVATVALLAASLTAASSTTFPPFPEPAVGPFPDTFRMTLESQLVPAEVGAFTPRLGVLLNDIWGWTSEDGEQYALFGTGDGMSIVRVTDPDDPVHIGIMPTPLPDSVSNLWGDVATVDTDEGSFAYFTTEADGAGIQILRLDQLDDLGPAPDPSHPIPPTAVFSDGGYDSAHNIFINEDSGFAYIAGVGLSSTGETACDGQDFHPARFNTLILDLNDDPLDPEIAACVADNGEHDFYVVDYRGPDKDYHGREIAFVFDGRERDSPFRGGSRTDDTPGELVGGTTEIWDVTDKDDIEIISSFTVPGLCFSHQGWTEGPRHEFLLINDELDELRDAEPADGFFRTNFCDTDAPGGTVTNSGLFVMDIKDLDNPVFQERFALENASGPDHNFVRRGNKLFWAVYDNGTRVLKMQEKKGVLQLSEFARMDTEPRDVPPFFGQWGIYPFPESETIVASDINNGLMVMTLGDDEDGGGD